MREPKELIEECKKHLRDTEQYKHEYKKDIRKLITALEKQLAISGVVVQSEQLVCDCGNTEDVKNIPICASCYNPHSGEW